MLLVGFGQQICNPVSPKCGGCLNATICPVGKMQLKRQKGQMKQEDVNPIESSSSFRAGTSKGSVKTEHPKETVVASKYFEN